MKLHSKHHAEQYSKNEMDLKMGILDTEQKGAADEDELHEYVSV